MLPGVGGIRIMIRYKVVTRSRHSMFANGVFHEVYEKGTTKHALSHTLGFMVFERRCDAVAWLSWISGKARFKRCISRSDYQSRLSRQIIRVDCHGRGKRPGFVSAVTSESGVCSFYNLNNDRGRETLPPQGTMCYHSLTVID